MDAVLEIAKLSAQPAECEAEMAIAHHLIEQYKAQLHKLRRMKFGQSSEALDAQIHQLELRLEDLEESEAAAKATAFSSRPRRSGASRCASHCRIICRARRSSTPPAIFASAAAAGNFLSLERISPMYWTKF